MRHYHADHTARLQVEIYAAGEEQPRDILVSRIPSACPYAVHIAALPTQLAAQRVGGLVVVQPGRVAYDDVHLAASERDRSDEIARVVRPDVVAPIVVQRLERADGGLQGGALGWDQ